MRIYWDLTSTSPYRYGQILSPFYPHQNIPIPFTPNMYATCVESVWQGLKVFEKADVDLSTFQNTSMHHIKRTTLRHGRILGHRNGINGSEILDYMTARFEIYLPTYKWILENIEEVATVINKIKERSLTHDIVFLDYNTNQDVHNEKQPISHAALVKLYIEDKYPI